MAANLIVHRPSDGHKVLDVTGGSGGGGVGIQLHARPNQPPPRLPHPQQQQRQPLHQQQPRHHPQQPAMNEEELLDTMDEFANPLKKGGGGGGAGGGEYLEDYDDEEGGEGEEEEEYEEGDERSEDMMSDDMPQPPHHQPMMQQQHAVVDQPGEGYHSIEEERSDIIFKLERLHRQGVKGIRSFTPFTDIREMRTELSRVRTELELERSVKFQRKIMMAIVSALEWGNTKFNPFDLELDGWSEQMHQSVQANTEYDGVFEELYFKYRGKVSTPPEIRLLLMVGGSAMMFHMTKSMMKSALPNMGDILQQNPQMMEALMKGFAPQQPQFNNGGGGGDTNNNNTNNNNGERREMRGPGIDVGGGLGGLGGLGGGLGGLAGLGGLGGGGFPTGFPGMPGPVPPPPPPPPAALHPTNTGRDRFQGQRPPPPPATEPDRMSDRSSDRLSDRLSDVLSDDLGSLPDDFSGSEAGSEAGAKRISLAPLGGRRAKRQKKAAAPAKKVITL